MMAETESVMERNVCAAERDANLMFTLVLFQTCLTFFRLWNTKADVFCSFFIQQTSTTFKDEKKLQKSTMKVIRMHYITGGVVIVN